MRLFLILPVLFLLACSSVPTDSPDPDQYLDRVRQMHAENRAQFNHLTTVTFAPPVAYTSDDPNEPAPTDEELKRDFLSLHAPRVADLSRASRFLRRQLDELNTMAVPEEHTDLHADLITMWEAGLAWVDDWLESTQDIVTYVWIEDWEAFDAFDNAYNDQVARLIVLSEHHINASSRVDFVLFGTPEPEPFDISGSSTARALTPLPEVPTAPLEPTPQPTSTPIPIATLVPQPLEITQTYEVRKLIEGDKVSQEEAYYIHFKAWERLAIAATALEECGLNIRVFDPRPHHTPDVVLMWHRALVGLARSEAAGETVVAVATVLGLDMNDRFTEEDWAAISPVFVRAVTIEQKYADTLERLLEAADCPK